ncbi:MAG TPA: NAD(P)(+) transhydrogenase (Re/Si-specific) subunit beta [Candidatus Acidoferrales bacterium]|nr:NAD(P)(+) transhydrogenase (Re/Si-specific) subunit beta [Candidatus Acidoferrales bacterium]
MVSDSVNPVEYFYLLAGVLFIVGLRYLGSPKTARLGNRISALGMVCAVGGVLTQGIVAWWIVLVGIAIGAAIGITAARSVKMTAMPQMVAIFNGCGGGAAALVATGELLTRIGAGETLTIDESLTTVLSAVIGAISFSGSIIAYLKLQELMTGRPIVYAGQQIVNALILLVMLAAGGFVIAGAEPVTALYVALGAAFALGMLFTLPIGGADMPVIISLLNSFTGLAAALTGFVLSNNVLIISGALVGASGTLLTVLMSKAMNRSLANVLFGAFGSVKSSASAKGENTGTIRSVSADDVGTMLAYANQVIVVPGYGMAVAQAQHTVRELAENLEERGVTVKYAIHPVAGRMPGHMNVLLAEADVPYDALYDMDDINPEFERTDVALIIGANDVTNPAARSDPSSPIYGMPILNVDRAANVVVLKRSMNPGFAGIDNPLYEDPKTVMLFGDAKKSIEAVNGAVKAL